MSDLIDRKALLASLDHARTIRVGVRELIKSMQTVESEPVVHARWVVNTDDFTPKKRCTNCGYNKPMKAGEGIEQEPEAFCPACGARMDADQPKEGT